MVADEFSVSHQHAAEILRPGAVGRGADEDVCEAARAQLLRVRREAKIAVDLALHEKLYRVAGGPMEVGSRIETDLRGNQVGQPGVVRCDQPALQLTHAANVLLGEQLVAADMDTGKHD